MIEDQAQAPHRGLRLAPPADTPPDRLRNGTRMALYSEAVKYHLAYSALEAEPGLVELRLPRP
jgi:hypothetical protein